MQFVLKYKTQIHIHIAYIQYIIGTGYFLKLRPLGSRIS